MRQKLLWLALGLLLATPAWSQTPADCPSNLFVPVNLSVPQPCPGQPLRLRAEACGPCVDLLSFTKDPSGAIRLHAAMDLRRCLPAVCMQESLEVDLGTFAAGHYVLTVAIDAQITRLDSTTCFATRAQTITFDVPLSCGPPPPGPLPHVDTIRIGPPPPCNTCPPVICPNLPIPFSIAGHFDDDCYQFRGLELRPNPMMNPLPQPPIARVIVAVNDCMGRPCNQTFIPWQASEPLPGLPTGNYGMIVEVAEVSWCDSSNVISLHSTIVPFAVAERCSIPPSPDCFLANWRHDPNNSGCDADVSPTSPATLVFQFDTSPALAGLQGRIALLPPELRVTQMRPIGAASGMRLAWQGLPDGASFVMFSDNGTLIPPAGRCPTAVPCGPSPVLEVTASAMPGMPPPSLTLARMVELMVTDSLGRAVMMCPTFAVVDMVARICGGSRECDANGDGRIDVRDLVVMVRCLRGVAICPDSVRARFDCNRDSVFTVDDVLCCARRILRGPLPDSLPPRRLADLRVQLGAPVATAAGFDQSVRVRGANLLGAARLALTLPSDVALSSVELPGAPAGWLHVEEGATGEALVGLIALAPDAASDVEVLLHFSRSTSGASAGGDVAMASAEFVGPEGEIVAPADGVLGIPDGAPVSLELSAARPNPFTRETRFELSLTSSSDVHLGIYDLSGRLVARIFRGPLGAGSHSFAWDGRRADGTRAADGVYFYRARAAGVLSARRLVLMHGN